MNLVRTELEGVVIIELDVYGDDRGFFMESWNSQRYKELGLHAEFLQDNISYSQRNVLRGLHFQNPSAQGKLVTVLKGEIYDVAVDIRVGSPTFGKWTGVVLSTENKRQLYVPEGFAHGFLVLSEDALVNYKCTDLYNKEAEQGICWNDNEIGIDWPVKEPILSAKDADAPTLREIAEHRLFRYEMHPS